MLRVCVLATAVCLLSLRDAHAGVFEWLQAHPAVVEIGADFGAGVANGFVQEGLANDPNHPEENMGRSMLRGVATQFINRGKNVVVERLTAVEKVSTPEVATAIRKLREAVEAGVTRKEYLAMVAAINKEMAAYAARVSEVEYRLTEMSRDTAENRKMVEYAQQANLDLRREFEEAMKRTDVSLAKLRVRMSDLEKALSQETEERKSEDAHLHSRINITEGRVSILEQMISPETRATTAEILAGQGGLMIAKDENPAEAAKLLQLAIAYDRAGQMQADPGARYFLAVAYRRLARNEAAEEMLTEAIVAERFRETSRWFELVAEQFQGPDRQWMENLRSDPRFGVRAPREVIFTKP
jgi:hypothetical protein